MHQSKLNTHDYNVETKGRLPEVHRFEHLTELARRRGERDIENANNNVRTEYRKRLHDTREMKSKMEHCISTLNVEVGILERCRGEVLAGLRNFEPNVALSAKWNSMRRGRPASPSMYHENVVRALSQNNDDLKASLAKLTSALTQLDESLNELKKCQRFVQHEIDAKMATMIIDNACMEELINPSDLMGPAGAQLPLKSQSAIMQSSKLHTLNEWSNTAESVISTALAQIEVSQSRRKKALSVLRTIREAGRYNRSPLVLDALQSRMKYNQSQLATLDLNISMLSGQIDLLDKQKASLVGSLEKIIQQQTIARQRLDVRAMLPSKENTRPNVETTLEVEIVNLERNERDLRAKLNELEKNLQKQLLLRESMEAERRDRTNSFSLDKACFEMRLPSISSRSGDDAASRPRRDNGGDGEEGSARSGRSSDRGSNRSVARDGNNGADRGSSRGYGNVPRPPLPQGTSGYNPYGRGEFDDATSLGRSSGRSQGSGRSKTYNGQQASARSSVAAVGEKSYPLPPIPAPPSPRGTARQQRADVEALLHARTSASVRSARSSPRR